MKFAIGDDWLLGFLTLLIGLPIVGALVFIFLDGGAVFERPAAFLWLALFIAAAVFGAWLRKMRIARRGTGRDG